MQIIKKPTNKAEVFNNSIIIDDLYIKAVVDVGREIIAINAGMHSDLEQLLLDDGSLQTDLWGINLYKNFEGGEWIEFDSMINIRPKQNNRSRGVEDENIRHKITEIINSLLL